LFVVKKENNMKKLAPIFVLIFGLGIFVSSIIIATPTPALRATSDNQVLFAKYEAPVASFMGSIPPSMGLAHVAKKPAQMARTVEGRAEELASNDGPVFGRFSTLAAMSYHASDVHITKVPNPKPLITVPARKPVSKGEVEIGEIIYESQK
jgi:hypothetical protein